MMKKMVEAATKVYLPKALLNYSSLKCLSSFFMGYILKLY